MINLNADKIKSIGICGSFGKHLNDISIAKELFEKYGFTVLVPTSTKLSNTQNNENFLLLESDIKNSPKKLEKDYLENLLKSDIVYCCNKDGYLGKSVMFELGFLIAKEQEVYFSEKPEESLISDLVPDNHIMSPENLCKKLISANNACWKDFSGNDYFDADEHYNPNFNFDR